MVRGGGKKLPSFEFFLVLVSARFRDSRQRHFRMGVHYSLTPLGSWHMNSQVIVREQVTQIFQQAWKMKVEKFTRLGWVRIVKTQTSGSISAACKTWTWKAQRHVEFVVSNLLRPSSIFWCFCIFFGVTTCHNLWFSIRLMFSHLFPNSFFAKVMGVPRPPMISSHSRIATYFGGGLVVGGVATLLRRSVQAAAVGWRL